jgi:16S rRNA C967 or C1407 C5-methylase (RsmB/RsmF family)
VRNSVDGAVLECAPHSQVEAYLATAFGAEGLRQINECLSRPPLNTCIRVNSLKATTQVGCAHLHRLLLMSSGCLPQCMRTS